MDLSLRGLAKEEAVSKASQFEQSRSKPQICDNNNVELIEEAGDKDKAEGHKNL